MKKRKTRKKNTPTPAQLRARKKFVAMVRARAKANKGRKTAKKANPRKRASNKTIIKAKRVKIMATNPGRRRNAVSGFVIQFVREQVRDGRSLSETLNLMRSAGFGAKDVSAAENIYKQEIGGEAEKKRYKRAGIDTTIYKPTRNSSKRRRNAVALPSTASSLRQQYDPAALRKQRDRLRSNIMSYQALTRKLTKQLKTQKDPRLQSQLAEIERLESREVDQLDQVLRKLSGATSIRKPRRNVEMGYRDSSGRFHPIRASRDYDQSRVGTSTRSSKARSRSAKAGSTARFRSQTKQRRATTSRLAGRALKRNPAVTAKSKATRKMFTGMKSRRTIAPLAPRGTPKSVAILGKLVKIKTRSRTFTPPKKKGRNPEPDIFLAADDRGNLHIVGDPLPIVPGPPRDLGEIIELDYATRKPHLGYGETTEFFHELGEEGGRRPHLVTDAEGHLKIAGGDYYLERDGIHD